VPAAQSQTKVKWRIQNNFRQYGMATEKDVADAVNVIARDAATDAANAAPKDTGTLAGSVKVVKTATPAKPQAMIGTDTFYALHQEYGTKRGVTGRHYLLKGVKRARGRFVKELKKQLPS
jgi:hypothetical protein